MEKRNSHEENEWLENYQKQLLHENEMMLSEHGSTIDSFIEYCSNIGIVLEKSNFHFVPTIGVVAEYPDIVTHLVSDLSIDKENLVHWGSIPKQLRKGKMTPGYLYADNFIVMASPIFRRGLYANNNWAPRFVDIFWKVEAQDIDAYIALDYNRVRVNVDSSFYFEADTWYGAPFNEEIKNIGDGVANLRPPSDLETFYLDFLFSNVYALDIFWYTHGEIKTFQALEFKGDGITVDIDGETFYPARYVHAEYELSSGYFRHFDGAIQYYTKSEYLVRRESNFRHNIKDASKIKAKSGKAFKFNGKIPVDMWTEFCSHFFAHNPLIHEYFTGTYPQHLRDTLDRIRARREQNT